MTVVLDSGGLSALAGARQRIRGLLAEGLPWPPIVPTAVLVESLTGDHRRDFHTDKLLRECRILPLDELTARRAAVLRGAARRKGASAVDAIVVAIAEAEGDATILTSEPGDLGALAACAKGRIEVRKA